MKHLIIYAPPMHFHSGVSENASSSPCAPYAPKLIAVVTNDAPITPKLGYFMYPCSTKIYWFDCTFSLHGYHEYNGKKKYLPRYEKSLHPRPCGQARRAFIEPGNDTASFHIVDISENSRPHYHKKMTEIYHVFEDNEPLSSMMTVGFKTRNHRFD